MIAVTSSSSITVGTTLNTASRSTDWMPCDAAVDRARQAAGLAVEMEAQADSACRCWKVRSAADAHRALLHLGEQRVAQLAEPGGADAQQAVADRPAPIGTASSAVPSFGASASTMRP